MEIIYCRCGKRITGEEVSRSRQVNGEWFCPTCLSQSPTGDQDPVTKRPRSGASTGTTPATGATTRRGGVAAAPRPRPAGAAPAGGSPIPFILLGVGVLVFAVGVFFVMSGGSSSANKPSSTSTAHKTEAEATPAQPTSSVTTASGSGSSPAVPSTSGATSTPSTTTTPAATTLPTFRPPTVSGSDAEAKFKPLKERFQKARLANDLKEMGAVAADLGMITRDFDGTGAAQEAMELIKVHKELRAMDEYKQQCEAPFIEATRTAKRMSDDLADLVERIQRFAKQRKDTDAGAKADELVKAWRERSAESWWSRLKSKVEGEQPSQRALVEIGTLAREFGGTKPASEALAAYGVYAKKVLEKDGPSAWLQLLKDVVQAPNAAKLREAVNTINQYQQAGIGPADPRLDELRAEALKALAEAMTNKNRPQSVFSAPGPRFNEFFSPLDGTRMKKDAADAAAVALTSKAGQELIQVLHPTGIPVEDAVFTLEFKPHGLKRVLVRVYSTTHKLIFDHELKDAKADAWNKLTLQLSDLKKDDFRLHNAWMGLLIVQGEKADASSEEAGLAIKSAALEYGRK
ncbi:MAG: hypothetical protein M5U26_11385 [Planctomycetota bacterium]|nr:hypothetical protein [Planctomycetota bacterium]